MASGTFTAWWPRIVKPCRLLSASTTTRGVVPGVQLVVCVVLLWHEGSMRHVVKRCDAEPWLELCTPACRQCLAHLLLNRSLLPGVRPWAGCALRGVEDIISVCSCVCPVVHVISDDKLWLYPVMLLISAGHLQIFPQQSWQLGFCGCCLMLCLVCNKLGCLQII